MKIDPRHLRRERALNLLYEAEMKEVSCTELLEGLALLPDAGLAYCWGRDNKGQLGDGEDSKKKTTPTPVFPPEEESDS